MYYAKSTKGFYAEDIHGDSIPQDAVEITGDEYASLLRGQECGMVIASDSNGHPGLIPQMPPTQDEMAEQIRAQRYAKLRECDWTQVQDVPLNNELITQWKAYRQALRDITEQPTFPVSVTWPDTPTKT